MERQRGGESVRAVTPTYTKTAGEGGGCTGQSRIQTNKASQTLEQIELKIQYQHTLKYYISDIIKLDLIDVYSTLKS